MTRHWGGLICSNTLPLYKRRVCHKNLEDLFTATRKPRQIRRLRAKMLIEVSIFLLVLSQVGGGGARLVPGRVFNCESQNCEAAFGTLGCWSTCRNCEHCNGAGECVPKCDECEHCNGAGECINDYSDNGCQRCCPQGEGERCKCADSHDSARIFTILILVKSMIATWFLSVVHRSYPSFEVSVGGKMFFILFMAWPLYVLFAVI